MRGVGTSAQDLAQLLARELLSREFPQVLVDLIDGYAQHFKGVQVPRTQNGQNAKNLNLKLFNASTSAASAADGAWAMVQGNHEVILTNGRLRTTGKSESMIVALCLLSGKLATAATDQTVRFWDTQTGACLSTFKGKACFWALSFAGLEVAAGSEDGLVHLFCATTFALKAKLKGHSRGVGAVAYLTDGNLVSGAPRALLERDSEVIVWDLATRQMLKTILLPAWWTMDLLACPGGKFLSLAKELTVWDQAGNKACVINFGLMDVVLSACVLPDGTIATYGNCAGNSLKVWDPDTGKCLKTVKMPAVTSMCVSGGKLVTGHADGTLREWE